MIRRVANRIVPVVDQLAINCRPDQREAIEEALAGIDVPIEYRPDDEPDLGPVAGIENGLRDCEARYAFVAACDMPFIQSDVVELLFDVGTDADAAVPILDEWYQPLHAVYRTDAMRNACAAARAAGEDRIVHALDRLDVVTVDEAAIESVGTPETFENVNTREEFQDAAQRLASE